MWVYKKKVDVLLFYFIMIFRFFFIKLKYIVYIPLKRLAIFL